MSDDTKALIDRLRDHENEGVTGSDRFHLRNEAADTVERLQRDRNALAERADRLHDALRRIAVKPSSAVATHCSLCKGSWAFNRPGGEWHEPDCLAAPKDAP